MAKRGGRGKQPRIPKRHASAITNNDVSETFTQGLADVEARLRSEMQWVLPLLDRQVKGLKGPAPGNPERYHGISSDELIDGVTLAEHVVIGKLWGQRGRISYDLNEHFAAELYRSTSDELPGRVFDHVPHINPLVILPDPWPIACGLARGFYIYGLQRPESGRPPSVCFTNDPDRYALGLMFVVDLLDKETGEVSEQMHVTARVPTNREKFTLADAVKFSTAKEKQTETRTVVTGIFEELMRPALSILLYLCCDNRDMVEPVPFDRQLTSTHRKKRDRSPFFIEVGYRIGPKLHALRRAAGRLIPEQGTPSGVEHAPHQKCGHFKEVRFGPKRSLSTTKWIDPYWVRLDLLEEGADPITTIVGVEEQRHDPLRRRGLKKKEKN